MSTNDRWGVIDEQSIAEARELIGVPLRRDRMQWNKVATADAVRQFAAGVEDDNPFWAAAGRALPSFLYSVDATIVAPKLPGVQWIYAGTRWRWYDTIAVGDVFDVEAKFTEMVEKTGKRFGLWVLQTGEIVYRRNDGSLLCVAEGRVARTPRQGGGGGGGSGSSTTATPEPSHAPATSDEARRGATPRLWEDTAIGNTIGPVAKLLELDSIFAYYTGAQGALHYGGAHGDAVRYRRRHDDYAINAKTGAKDSAARGHFSSKEGKDVGMGGAYDVGLQRIGWVIAFLTDWMGDDAHLAETDVDVLLPNVVGDTTYLSARVTDRWFEDNGFVRLEIDGRNQYGAVTTRGSALVALPSSQHGSVALPLFGGDQQRWTTR